jgi:hypothetical protein
MDRTAIGYALVFAVPVGLGVAVGVLRTAKNFTVAGIAGAVAALALFLFVVLVSSTGSPDVERPF